MAATPSTIAAAPTRRSVPARYAGTLIAVTAIWLAVILTGFFAKDFVSGSEQQHIHLAALQNWFWGLFATGFVCIPLLARRHRDGESAAAFYALGAATAAIWLVVTLLSIFAPVFVTGSDPTRIPLAAILSPIVGMVATGFAAVFVTVINRGEPERTA